MISGALKVTTKQLFKLCHTLKIAGVTAFVVVWSVVPPEQEDGWTMLAWAVDIHRTHRYLFVKAEVQKRDNL